ncbi:hypothetical protein EGW08_010000, partial [Elysia chlorotica]
SFVSASLRSSVSATRTSGSTYQQRQPRDDTVRIAVGAGESSDPLNNSPVGLAGSDAPLHSQLGQHASPNSNPVTERPSDSEFTISNRAGAVLIHSKSHAVKGDQTYIDLDLDSEVVESETGCCVTPPEDYDCDTGQDYSERLKTRSNQQTPVDINPQSRPGINSALRSSPRSRNKSGATKTAGNVTFVEEITVFSSRSNSLASLSGLVDYVPAYSSNDSTQKEKEVSKDAKSIRRSRSFNIRSLISAKWTGLRHNTASTPRVASGGNSKDNPSIQINKREESPVSSVPRKSKNSSTNKIKDKKKRTRYLSEPVDIDAFNKRYFLNNPDAKDSAENLSSTPPRDFDSDDSVTPEASAVFTQNGQLSLRARADRSLTGTQHHLDAVFPRERSHSQGSARSAPNSARTSKEKRNSQVRFKTDSFLDLRTVPVSDYTYEVKETLFVHEIQGNSTKESSGSENNGNNAARLTGSAGPDLTAILSGKNNTERTPSSVRGESVTNSATITSKSSASSTSKMLSSNNHDHEILPYSHGGTNGTKSSGSNSLLRSRGLFSSTPSLFSKSSPEEKFWKKELKKEKEQKKKMEEERKKFEKEVKKEEKRRKKVERKAATLTARTVPRDWNYVSRPIESVYMRPRLQMRAVPIDYQDDPRIPPPHQAPPPRPVPPGHPSHGAQLYAMSSVALKGGGGYGLYASTPDLARVEQVYGTAHRRPIQPHVAHYAAPYGYTRFPHREQLPRVVLLHRSSEGYGFVLRGAKSKLPTGGGFNDFAPTAEYPAL